MTSAMPNNTPQPENMRPSVDALRRQVNYAALINGNRLTPEFVAASSQEQNDAILLEFSRRYMQVLAEKEDLIDQVIKLEAQVGTDALTGLLSRRAFTNVGEVAIRTARRPLAVMALDVNEFKNVNDIFGHAAGDAALKYVAEEFSGAVRESDIVARIGGDEFVAILLDVDPEQIIKAGCSRYAKTFRNLGKPFGTQKGKKYGQGVTIGTVVVDDPSAQLPSLQGLLTQADSLMYKAKTEKADKLVRVELGRYDPSFEPA